MSVKAQLQEVSVIESIDEAFLAQLLHGRSSERVVDIFHPLLCPPFKDVVPGAVEMRRSYQQNHCLTIHRVPNTPRPTCKLRSLPLWNSH